MAVNYAESYSKELANAYPYTLYSGALWSTENSSKYKVVDAKTITTTVSTNNEYAALKNNEEKILKNVRKDLKKAIEEVCKK